MLRISFQSTCSLLAQFVFFLLLGDENVEGGMKIRIGGSTLKEGTPLLSEEMEERGSHEEPYLCEPPDQERRSIHGEPIRRARHAGIEVPKRDSHTTGTRKKGHPRGALHCTTGARVSRQPAAGTEGATRRSPSPPSREQMHQEGPWWDHGHRNLKYSPEIDGGLPSTSG